MEPDTLRVRCGVGGGGGRGEGFWPSSSSSSFSLLSPLFLFFGGGVREEVEPDTSLVRVRWGGGERDEEYLLSTKTYPL